VRLILQEVPDETYLTHSSCKSGDATMSSMSGVNAYTLLN